MLSLTTASDHRHSTFFRLVAQLSAPLPPIRMSSPRLYFATICGNSALFQSNVAYTYSGSDDVEIKDDELQICSDFDFISQMATFDVEVSTADVLPRREIFSHAEHIMIS